MDFKEVFSTQVLPIIQTNKPSIVLKKCTRCKKAYDGSNFKFNVKKQTYPKQCISCQEKQLESVMKHYNKNKEYRNKVKEYRDTHRASETFLQWRENRKHDEHVKELKREENRRYRENNTEKVKEQAKQHSANYYAKHKDTEEYKARRKENRSKPETKAQRNKYQMERRHNDIAYRIRDNLSSRISRALKDLGSTKSENTIKYLDCSFEFFVEHIEAHSSRTV